VSQQLIWLGQYIRVELIARMVCARVSLFSFFTRGFTYGSIVGSFLLIVVPVLACFWLFRAWGKNLVGIGFIMTIRMTGKASKELRKRTYGFLASCANLLGKDRSAGC